MKKEYIAPEMEMVKLVHQVALLNGSDEPCDAEYCDELGYGPGAAADPKS